MLLWLLAQLVFWAVLVVAVVVGCAVVVLAPPFFAGRYLWLRFR